MTTTIILILAAVAAVLITLLCLKSRRNGGAEAPPPSLGQATPNKREDVSRLFSVNAVPTGDFTGGPGQPSYMIKAIYNIDVEQKIRVHAETTVQLDIEYQYVNGYDQQGQPIIRKARFSSTFTLAPEETFYRTIAGAPALQITKWTACSL